MDEWTSNTIAIIVERKVATPEETYTISPHQPNVKQKASAPPARNSISNRRSRIVPG